MNSFWNKFIFETLSMPTADWFVCNWCPPQIDDQWPHDVEITLLMRQNYVATLFWRNNGAIITQCGCSVFSSTDWKRPLPVLSWFSLTPHCVAESHGAKQASASARARPLGLGFRLLLRSAVSLIMTSSNGTFSALLALCAGIHRSLVNPRTKASEAELWCFLWSGPE